MSEFTIERHETREAWLKAKRTCLGASEAAALLGLSTARHSPFSLWAEKTAAFEREVDDENEDLVFGNVFEDGVAQLYARRYPERALEDWGRWTLLRSSAHPFLGCTLDRVVVAGHPGGVGALECKTSRSFRASEWEENGAPVEYQAQVMAQLAVTGWGWADLAVLIDGGRRRWDHIELDRNDGFIAELVEVARDFWRRVELREPPPADGHPATTEALRRLHPADNGIEIALPAEALEWAQALAEAKAAVKDAEARADEAANRLKAAIGDATFGVLPSGGRFSYKTQSRKEHVVAASTFRVLRKG